MIGSREEGQFYRTNEITIQLQIIFTWVGVLGHNLCVFERIMPRNTDLLLEYPISKG